MKAIKVYKFGDPEVMRLEETQELEVDSEEALIQIMAVGVNPVDTYFRAGWYGPKKFPFTPGFDAAGIVLRAGQNIDSVTEGQRVFLSGSVTGTYAQQTLCRPSHIHLLPESISFEQGAAIGVPYYTAYRALFQRGCAKKSETVLIHGASGGVGIAAVQFAKASGLKVIATAGSQAGLDLMAQLGADLTLDHSDSAHLEKAIEFSDGRGVDIVLEMLANVNLGKDLPVLAKHGRVVIIGSHGSVEIDPRDLMSREASVIGVMSNLATQQHRQEAYEAIEAGLKDGTLNPVIEIQLPLSEAPRAHEKIMESGHHGKIVLIP
jgi:NADPH2:quinone reductase